MAVNSEVNDWLSRVSSNGGTVSAGTESAVDAFVTREKDASRWSKYLRVNLFCGDNQAAAVVPLVVGDGSSTETVTGGAYTQTGGFNSSVTSIDTGLNANTLTTSNVTLALYRDGNESSNTLSNLFGTNTSFNELGIIRGNTSTSAQFHFAVQIKNSGVRTGIEMASQGFLSASSGNTGTKLYKNGYVTGLTSTVATGSFNSNTLGWRDASNKKGYIIGTSLTDAEHLGLATSMQTFQTALSRQKTPYLQRRVIFLGDSLTYGYGPGFTQVSQPYPTQVKTLRSWSLNNSDLYNSGTSGISAETLLSNISNQTSIYYPPATNIVFLWAGTNDLMNNNRTAVQTIGYLENICTTLRSAGFLVYVLTLFSNITYTATYTANYNSQVGTVNNTLKTDARFSNGTLANGVISIDNISELQDTTNTTNFQDGLHPTTAGYTYVATAVNNFLNAASSSSSSNIVSSSSSSTIISSSSSSLFQSSSSSSVFVVSSSSSSSTISLTAPKNVILSFRVYITWDAVPGAINYKIFRSDTQNEIANTSNTYYTDIISNISNQQYKIVAVDNQNNQVSSQYTNPVLNPSKIYKLRITTSTILGRFISIAVVTLKDNNNNIIFKEQTRGDGSVMFQVPPGIYKVSIETSDFYTPFEDKTLEISKDLYITYVIPTKTKEY